VELPYHMGAPSCLHLLSLISLIDERLAVAYKPLLSVVFYERLRRRKIQIVEIGYEEFKRAACNVLTLAPGKCLMLEGNQTTQRRLEKSGCKVMTFRGDEICLNAEGGPSCLALSVLRRK
jgi:N-dimethylarginine dimethylaminohydrolase